MNKNIESRRKAIVEMVNRFGAVDFTQLRNAFPDVSDVTLRKDLQYLNDTQQALRVHGGLKSMPSALNFYFRSNLNTQQKAVIAEKAAELIQPGESIFISAGTSCAELAKRLPDFPLSVCSDGIYTVNNIHNQPNISVQLLGGEVNLEVMRVEGLSALNQLDQKHFSTAFMGALSADANYGFFNASSMTATILGKVVDLSDRVVLLMDSSKVNYTFTPYFIPLSKVDVLITDHNVDPAFASVIQESGIRIILA